MYIFRKGLIMMKNKENKENKVIKEKNKIDKRQVATKIFAFVMLILMLFASCSTCIYYVVTTIQK
jgi:hypothetical protein